MSRDKETRTPEEEACYREWKNKPLTSEEIEFLRNPGELVPMRDALAELKDLARKKREASGMQ